MGCGLSNPKAAVQNESTELELPRIDAVRRISDPPRKQSHVARYPGTGPDGYPTVIVRPALGTSIIQNRDGHAANGLQPRGGDGFDNYPSISISHPTQPSFVITFHGPHGQDASGGGGNTQGGAIHGESSDGGDFQSGIAYHGASNAGGHISDGGAGAGGD
ncbi:hypothetical protein S40285_10151 [Stachybotrys chlorohalonatus IBT 40285]|uniref:Uncharacterized protein n=1 Tax=Stachybotrys chlorohalonatus (strain IBT 40285) TaxID=1283841 RepID=A0A084R184_STAC4|nr:hypothetical protein S40285_10151 [Stachybotrys chlorohalonata IBT 40285]